MKLGKLGKRFKVFTWILTGIALVLIYKFDNVFRNPGVPLLQTLPYMAFLFCAGGLILLREGAAAAHLGDIIRLWHILLFFVIMFLPCIPIYLLKMREMWLPGVLIFDLAMIFHPILWATIGNWFFDYDRHTDRKEADGKYLLGSAVLWAIIFAAANVPIVYIWAA